jgi:hypothetical protein
MMSGRCLVFSVGASSYRSRSATDRDTISATGAVLRGPAAEGLAIHEVREYQGELQVNV